MFGRVRQSVCLSVIAPTLEPLTYHHYQSNQLNLIHLHVQCKGTCSVIYGCQLLDLLQSNSKNGLFSLFIIFFSLGVRNPQRLTFYYKILGIYQIRWLICQNRDVFIKIPIFICQTREVFTIHFWKITQRI